MKNTKKQSFSSCCIQWSISVLQIYHLYLQLTPRASSHLFHFHRHLLCQFGSVNLALNSCFNSMLYPLEICRHTNSAPIQNSWQPPMLLNSYSVLYVRHLHSIRQFAPPILLTLTQNDDKNCYSTLIRAYDRSKPIIRTVWFRDSSFFSSIGTFLCNPIQLIASLFFFLKK